LDGSNTEGDTKSSGKGMNARTVFTDVCVLVHSHHSFILHHILLQTFHGRMCVGALTSHFDFKSQFSTLYRTKII